MAPKLCTPRPLLALNLPTASASEECARHKSSPDIDGAKRSEVDLDKLPEYHLENISKAGRCFVCAELLTDGNGYGNAVRAILLAPKTREKQEAPPNVETVHGSEQLTRQPWPVPRKDIPGQFYRKA